ncbi:hypothetical protein [Methylovirgula sp. HY1]|uniref:hypothetical protein n=1 Tax=Methylovirgula sp. HY1 TaxID=2822761 RepID=UPI001C5BB6E8|nr:hypothetical protein [Methylovirgula sp. HY1]QXX73798.1 hypothetical protein MHY1_00598 [Methylovirgula sp. HY1]
MSAWTVTAVSHRMLGPMIRLEFGEGPGFDLTAQEAGILARALAAVREGKSPVDEVYMSPIASNGDFSGKVAPDGINVAAAEPISLGWDEVDKMAAALAALAG